MHIGEICRRCGLTRKAVEYYVEQGLARPGTDGSGYRDFSDADAAVLMQVSVLRRLGLGIPDIRRITGSGDKRRALDDCLAKLELELRRTEARRECLAYLRDHPDDFDGASRLYESRCGDALTIREKLLQAFPGGFGVFIGLHFGRFLEGKVDSKEKAAAYRDMVAFLDSLKEFTLPKELESFLEQAFGHGESDAIRSVDDGLISVAGDFQGFMSQNREHIEAYLHYRGSDEYKSSPAYGLRRQLLAFMKSAGYYDVFLPSMKALSEEYREYVEKLEAANRMLLQEYPQAAEVLNE